MIFYLYMQMLWYWLQGAETKAQYKALERRKMYLEIKREEENKKSNGLSYDLPVLLAATAYLSNTPKPRFTVKAVSYPAGTAEAYHKSAVLASDIM